MSLYQRQTERIAPDSHLPGVQAPDFGSLDLNAEETRRQALQAVMSELEEEVKKRLDSACVKIVEETRSRLRKELGAALEAFGKEAGARLRVLEQDQLTQSTAKLQIQMSERVQQQISEIQAALDKPCGELKTLAAQAETAVSSMAMAVDAAA